jgi:hypothetical protein
MEKTRKKTLVTDDGQLMFFKTDWFDQGSWLREKEFIQQSLGQIHRYVGVARATQDEWMEWHGKMNWVIGDWILAGKAGGVKVRALRQHIKDVKNGGKGLSSGTLSNIMTVCKAIEPSRRRENLSFSMHLLVAKKRFSREEQDKLLGEASERVSTGVKYGSREFGKKVRSAEASKKRQEYKPPSENDTCSLPIYLTTAQWRLIHKIAGAKGFKYDTQAIAWMAEEYYKANEEQLKAEVAAYEVREVERRHLEAIEHAKQVQEWIERRKREDEAADKEFEHWEDMMAAQSENSISAKSSVAES